MKPNTVNKDFNLARGTTSDSEDKVCTKDLSSSKSINTKYGTYMPHPVLDSENCHHHSLGIQDLFNVLCKFHSYIPKVEVSMLYWPVI